MQLPELMGDLFFNLVACFYLHPDSGSSLYVILFIVCCCLNFFLSNFGLPQSFGGLMALQTFVLLPMIVDQVWASCNFSFLPVQLSLMCFSLFFLGTPSTLQHSFFIAGLFFFSLLPGPYTNDLKCSLSVSKINLLKHSVTKRCWKYQNSIWAAFCTSFWLCANTMGSLGGKAICKAQVRTLKAPFLGKVKDKDRAIS